MLPLIFEVEQVHVAVFVVERHQGKQLGKAQDISLEFVRDFFRLLCHAQTEQLTLPRADDKSENATSVQPHLEVMRSLADSLLR